MAELAPTAVAQAWRRFPSAGEIVASAGGTDGSVEALSPLSREALRRLVDGYARRDLGRSGKLFAAGILVESVKKLLRLRSPIEPSRPIRRPVLIVAPPRTASTALHRMLALHPAFATPLPWEVAYAPPRAGEADTRSLRLVGALAAIRRASPRLLDLHPVSPDAPEECFALLETSLVSTSFVYHGAPDGYAAWLDTLGPEAWDEAYASYAAGLGRLARGQEQAPRWLLKSGTHLHGLGALLRAFPDASVVQLHRDPLGCAVSFARLLEAHHTLYLRGVDRRAVGRLALDHLATALARAAEARRASPTSRFLDLDAGEIARAPVEAAARVAAFAGEPLTAVVRDRFVAWSAANPAAAAVVTRPRVLRPRPGRGRRRLRALRRAPRRHEDPMRLVFVYGPPAAGKLTVARHLAAMSGYQLFHNHLSRDAVTAVIPADTPAFTRVIRGVRLSWLEGAADARVPGVVFTFVYFRDEDDVFVDRVRSLVEDRGGDVCMVQLTCDIATLERRVTEPSRARFGKLRDREGLARMIAAHEIFSAVPGRKSLRIDTAARRPEESARIVADHYALPAEGAHDTRISY